MPTTKTSTQALEVIEAELSSLEDKLEAAHAKKARASKELEELAPRRREISMAVLEEAPEAEAELKELARRRAELQMEAEAAADASQRLQELLEEARTRRDEAARVVHREEYERLLEEQDKLEAETEELLNQYLDKQAELKALRSKVYSEGRAAGLNITYDVASVADKLYERARAWELRQ